MATYDSALAIANLRTATYDALKARFAALAPVVDALGAERQALAVEIKRREADAAARARMGTLSADEKLVFKAIINDPNFARM